MYIIFILQRYDIYYVSRQNSNVAKNSVNERIWVHIAHSLKILRENILHKLKETKLFPGYDILLYKIQRLIIPVPRNQTGSQKYPHHLHTIRHMVKYLSYGKTTSIFLLRDEVHKLTRPTSHSLLSLSDVPSPLPSFIAASSIIHKRVYVRK